MITTLSMGSTAYASIDSDLNHFFDELGFSGNITQAQSYHSQTAGYYTGGSLFERNTVRNAQMASVQLPSFRGGCGGIDLFTGGFSFINSNELIQAFKNIANNAASYAFMLAIETVSPLMGEQMKNLQSIANTINQSNLNSCEMGASLVGGFWPKTEMAQKHVCETIGSSTNLFSDWAAARQGCGAGGNYSSTLASGRKDNRFKDMIVDNGNIAWKAIQRNEFLAHDTQLAELFMSLSGSLIIKRNGGDDNSAPQLFYLPSLSHHQSLLKALLQGGPTTLYHCNDISSNECLNITSQTVMINPQKALANRVRTLLQGMVDKIQLDKPLSAEEIGLLQSTTLPVYKMLNVNAAYAKGSPVLEVTHYADIIASDILYQYLTESLESVQVSSSVLPLPDEFLKRFQEGITSARLQVNEERQKLASTINVALEMIQKVQLVEQQLAGGLSVDFQSP